MASTSMSSGRWMKASVCATIGGTYQPVLGMNATEINESTAVDVTDTYENVQYSEAGTNDKTYALDGGWISDDPGQLIIRAGKAALATIYLEILPSGRSADSTENVRGFRAPVRVGSTRFSSPIGTKQKWGVDLLPDGTPATQGTGGYIL